MGEFPDSTETFGLGEVSLTAYYYSAPLRNLYKIRSGVGVLQVTEADLRNLYKLLNEYHAAFIDPVNKRRWKWWRRTEQ